MLELIRGPTLADRIAQGPIPVDEALPIAKQICDALEAAHEQGIIHRAPQNAPAHFRAHVRSRRRVSSRQQVSVLAPGRSSRRARICGGQHQASNQTVAAIPAELEGAQAEGVL